MRRGLEAGGDSPSRCQVSNSILQTQYTSQTETQADILRPAAVHQTRRIHFLFFWLAKGTTLEEGQVLVTNQGVLQTSQ